MTEKSVRNLDIGDATCPVCLQPTLGIDEMSGKSQRGYVDEEGKEVLGPVEWYKPQCATCKSTVERFLLGWLYGGEDQPYSSFISEEVSPSLYGLALRENRELKETIRSLQQQLGELKAVLA